MFKDRRHAGVALAAQLQSCAHRHDVVVLALPRGGVPVGYEIAKALHAPLDIFLVRKLGIPGDEEVAFGALAADGTRLFNQDILSRTTLTAGDIEAVIAREREVLQARAKVYSDAVSPPNLGNRHVILVDDGFATGATARVAIRVIRRQFPKSIIVALPVAPATPDNLVPEADALVCLERQAPFYSVGQWYERFDPVTDDEVRSTLRRARSLINEPHSQANAAEESLARQLSPFAVPIDDDNRGYDELVDLATEARFILIGGASHGADEFHRVRAYLTQRLVSVLICAEK